MERMKKSTNSITKYINSIIDFFFIFWLSQKALVAHEILVRTLMKVPCNSNIVKNLKKIIYLKTWAIYKTCIM